jgi:hypothetical protein
MAVHFIWEARPSPFKIPKSWIKIEATMKVAAVPGRKLEAKDW